MSTTLMQRTTTSTCEAFAGSLLLPCPNAATESTVVRGQRREVCPAHALVRQSQPRG